MPARLLHTTLLVTAAAILLAAGGRAQLVPNLGGQRAGISAFQFLKIGVGARGVAMGESFVAVATDGSALYWNPAGLAQVETDQVIAAHTAYVVDINHSFLGATYHLTASDVIGLSVSGLYMDEMEVTTEVQPLGTGRTFSFGDVGIGLSYARRMTDQFSFGFTVRYVEETLDVLAMRSVMFDLGTYYWTGLGSIRFAVVIGNFGADVAPTGTVQRWDGSTASPDARFSPPTVFRFGVAMEPYKDESQRLTASIQLNHPNDNAEHFRLGLEYSWEESLFLRGGLKRTIGQPLFGADATSDELFSVGAGFAATVMESRVSADYALSSYELLGSVHRISLALTY